MVRPPGEGDAAIFRPMLCPRYHGTAACALLCLNPSPSFYLCSVPSVVPALPSVMCPRCHGMAACVHGGRRQGRQDL